MIGLVDYDLQTSTTVNLIPPNIEIMKLAAYYRNEENTFCRLVSLDETELDGYDKIYFFSEKSLNPVIPDAFKRTNVIYGGSTFTYDYVPFENSIIDFTLPRTFIYKDFLKQKYQDGTKTKIINHILDDTYYRNYAGEQKLPLPAVIPNKRIFLYDKKFFYPDWEETIEKLTARKPSTIIHIHPIICNKLSQYFKVRNMQKISRTNDIILELNIPLNDINYMFNHYKNLFLADITDTSNVFLSLGNTFNTKLQYYKDYIYKLNLLYSFWSHNIPIKIKYIYPQAWAKNPIENLSRLTETWANGKTKTSKTLNDRLTVKNKKNTPIESEERDIMFKYYPEAKTLFDQNFTLIADRRYWKL